MKTMICAILVLLAIASAAIHGLGNKTISSRASEIARLNEQILRSDGGHLLDLSTGQPVDCTTDLDCYEKTGIDPMGADMFPYETDRY